MEEYMLSDVNLMTIDRFDYDLLVKMSLESHMGFLSIVHRVVSVLQMPGTSSERVVAQDIRETKPQIIFTDGFTRMEEACLGFDVANFFDVLGHPLRLHEQSWYLMQSVQKRCNNLLAQSCKEADALGNILQLYVKVLLVDVEQPDNAALMSVLRPLVQGLDKKTHRLTAMSEAFAELAKNRVEFAVEKAVAQLSDDLRAARATTVPFPDIPGF
ncbi:hypothetical protein C8Q73DRAFT_789354 [Cubamyces lactineus]|nr:hypothetical protein C8Q73DRAFT_789354 [Cubamyces lactineus]